MSETFMLLMMIMVNMYGKINLSDNEGSKYIVGGENARIKDFPFMVVLRTTKAPKRVFRCGGAYIRELWVLTAAHCILDTRDFPPIIAKDNAVRMTMGLERADQKKVQRRRSVKLVSHPKFYKDRKNMLNDIALIKIQRPFNITPEVNIGKLPKKMVPWEANVTAIGWGATKITDTPSSVTSPKQLQKIHLISWNETRCRRVARKKSAICVGEVGKMPCFGDSGGPLIYKGLVVGLSSWGYSCHGHVAVYEAIYNHSSWIRQTIAKYDQSQTSNASNLKIMYISYFAIVVSTVI